MEPVIYIIRGRMGEGNQWDVCWRMSYKDAAVMLIALQNDADAIFAEYGHAEYGGPDRDSLANRIESAVDPFIFWDGFGVSEIHYEIVEIHEDPEDGVMARSNKQKESFMLSELGAARYEKSLVTVCYQCGAQPGQSCHAVDRPSRIVCMHDFRYSFR